MPKIYLSYRPDDSQSIADRIYDKLATEFGSENIFRDISSIQPGRDQRGEILTAIVNHPVMLVIIGQNWVEATDEGGRKALLDKDDQIRIEVENGLQMESVRVVPVLVENATMPTTKLLPHDLIPLANTSPVEVRGGNDFENDMERLVNHLTTIDYTKSGNRWKPSSRKAGKGWLNDHSTAIIVTLIGGIFTIIAALIGILPAIIGDDDTQTPIVEATNTSTITIEPSATSDSALGGTIDPSPTEPILSPPPVATTQTPPQTGTITIIRDTNSWIVYVPVGDEPVSIEGLRFEVVDREPTTLGSYIPFQGVNFGGLTAPTCFVIYQESYVSPQQCGNIDNNDFHSAQISQSDIFWYDTVRNTGRSVAIYLGGRQLGICPDNASCEMDLSNRD